MFGINMTLDGCCDHTKGTPYEDIHIYFARLMQEADLVVYGRKTYELMVPFWPDFAKAHAGETNAINDFAQAFNSVNRVVFSRTLDKVEDEKTRIVHTDLKEEILRLKQQPGKNISVGGIDLPSQLMMLGLIDEFHFVVHPTLAGEGRRLLDGINLQEQLQLKLVEAKPLASGCVALRYMKT